jgi:hypothetical protein
MQTTLLAKSSSGEPYKVEFSSDGTSLRVFCHCQAGVLRQMCKHKSALLKGDLSMLFKTEQSALLAEIQALPEFARLKVQTELFENKLKEIETAKNELSKKEKAIKAEFARGVAQGFH